MTYDILLLVTEMTNNLNSLWKYEKYEESGGFLKSVLNL